MLNIARAALATPTTSTRNDRAEVAGWLSGTVEGSRPFVRTKWVFPPAPRAGMLFEVAFPLGAVEIETVVVEIGPDKLGPLADSGWWSYRTESRADGNWAIFAQRKSSPGRFVITPSSIAGGPQLQVTAMSVATGSLPRPMVRYLGEGIADTPGISRASGGENPYQNPYRGML